MLGDGGSLHPMDALDTARRHWYGAFYAGDTESLAHYEADDFLVANEQGRQTKAQQLAGIAHACQRGDWFDSVPERREYHVIETPLDGGKILSGVGHTVVGDTVVAKQLFTEVWTLDSGHWRIKALHYSPVHQ